MTMLEGFANAATNPSGTPTGATSVRPSPEGSLQSLAKAGQQVSDEVVENVALSGAAAIRRIIGERNELRRERERLDAATKSFVPNGQDGKGPRPLRAIGDRTRHSNQGHQQYDPRRCTENPLYFN